MLKLCFLHSEGHKFNPGKQDTMGSLPLQNQLSYSCYTPPDLVITQTAGQM